MRKSILNMLFALAMVIAVSAAFTACHSSRGSVAKATGARYKPADRHITINSGALPMAAVNLLREADTWIGVPYRYGGENRSGVDCSALVQKVFEKSVGVKMPRNSRKQADFCATIKRQQLVEGDLVFFSTNSSNEIGHVGIYVGGGQIIHASSSRGVMLSNLEEPYFQRHFKKAGRVDAYYAMLTPAGKSKKKNDSRRPADTNAVDPIIDDGTLLAASTPGPALNVVGQMSAAEFAARTAASAPRPEEPVIPEPVTVATVAATAPAVIETPAKPVAAAQTASPELTAEEARKRVLNTYREQPADSVLTPFFE